MPKQSNLNGWLQAKKRGRDDRQIEEDREAALEARKRKKAAPRKKTTTVPPKQTKAKPKPARKKVEDSESDFEDNDDDDDSINDFVVDDDDEEEEDEELEVEESSDEELEIVDKPVRKRTVAAAAKRTTATKPSVLEVESSSGSSDEGGTFLQSCKARPSKPSHALQRASIAAKTRRLPALSAAMKRPTLVDLTANAPTAGKKLRSKKKVVVSKSKPSSDSENLTSPSPQKQRKGHTNNDKDDDNYSSGSDVGGSKQPTKSKYFASDSSNKKKATTSSKQQDDSDDDEDVTTPIKARPSKRSSVTHLSDEESSDEDVGARRTKPSRATKMSTDSLLDSPEPQVGRTKKQQQQLQTKKKVVPNQKQTTTLQEKKTNKRPKYELSDESSDEDVQNAMRQSLDDTPEPKKKPTKKKAQPTKGKHDFSKFLHPKTSLDEDGSVGDHVITNEEASSADEDERIALQQALKASKKEARTESKRRGRVLDADDDDDESMDEDEERALQLALKQSKKEAKKQQNNKKKRNLQESSSEDERPRIEEILVETSEEEEVGEEYDDEEKAATSILHTAEQLSAQVLSTMRKWMKDDDTDGASCPQGMIVDGALRIGSVMPTSNDDDDSKKKSHQWISHEVMRIACSGVKLSEYQLIGVNWLALLHGMKCNIEGKQSTNVNGVLADEMGLGKTVQTIAFLAWLKHRKKNISIDVDSDDGASDIEDEPPMPHIIAVPVSVLPNWMREFEKFCPELNVVKYHGSMAEREEIQNHLRQYLPDKNKSRSTQPALDVILAPVTYFSKEKSDDRKFLNKFKFDYLVVDEAHMLKNSQSLRYKMLDKVKTGHRLLLTGTPVQNNPQELLNMLCFLMPLFSRGGESLEEGSDNVGDRMLHHFVDEKMEQSGDEQIAYKKLKHLFAPFVLRRKKADVIAQLLPAKERVIECVELGPKARSIYDSILEDHVNKSGSKITAAIGDHLFTNLRKAAHHPLLLRACHNSPAEIEHLTNNFHKYGAFKGEGSTKARVAEELVKFNDFHIHLTALDLIEENPHRRPDLERYILDEEALFCSAKFTRLRSLLPKLVSEGHRILIFSVWTSCLDLLGCLMEHLELKYRRMDGSCSSDLRQELIDEFNRDSSINVFLLSTKACGLGINLTAADTCIIHDLDFNPFNDLQAEDRCHRIGQKKKVTVYKMVTKDTVDADIFDMQERKSKMNAAIMESGAEAKKERKDMLKKSMERFLGSPKAKSVSRGMDKENGKDVICVI